MADPARHRRCTSLAVVSRTALAGIVLLTVSGLRINSASASGDPTVNGYILTNPVPGWTSVSASVGQTVVGTLQAMFAARNIKVTEAFEGWTSPVSPAQGELLITLIRFSSASVPASVTPTAMTTAVCTGADATPGSIAALPAVADSTTETCQSGTYGALTAIAWLQTDVGASIVAVGLPATTVDRIAQEESAKIPAAGISESSFPYLPVGGAVVLALIVLAIVLGRRRRNRVAPALAGGRPTAAAGLDYAIGFDDGHAGSTRTATPPAWAPPAEQAAWAPSATPAAWAPPATPAAESTPAAGRYRPAQAAPWDEVTPADGHATGMAPYAPSRPSQRATAGQTSYGGTQSFPGPSAVAFPGPGVHALPPSASSHPIEVGWYPIDGDPHRQRYWDGNGWTERLRWDGNTWIDES